MENFKKFKDNFLKSIEEAKQNISVIEGAMNQIIQSNQIEEKRLNDYNFDLVEREKEIKEKEAKIVEIKSEKEAEVEAVRASRKAYEKKDEDLDRIKSSLSARKIKLEVEEREMADKKEKIISRENGLEIRENEILVREQRVQEQKRLSKILTE